jgi:hypothetical protein
LLGKDRDPEPWVPHRTGSFETPEPERKVHADDD